MVELRQYSFTDALKLTESVEGELDGVLVGRQLGMEQTQGERHHATWRENLTRNIWSSGQN